MDYDAAKKLAGEKAAEFIQDGMIVGLGTGSTATFFISRLVERCKQGLKIKAVASSNRSLEQAKKGGIPTIDINAISSIDITVDGADEVDPQKRMIKGAGGALVREKIVASMSKEMVVIIDESKLVSRLGKSKLPVEVIPFGYKAALNKLEKLGYRGSVRMAGASPYVTDNGNYIFDLQLEPAKVDPAIDHARITQVTGVVDTGFFLNLAGRVVIGFFDGQIVIQ